MVDFRVVRAVHLLLGQRLLTLPEEDVPVRQQLASLLARGGVGGGDTVVLEMSGELDSTRMRAALAGNDLLSERSPSIWDIYRSEFGDMLLNACGAGVPAHHTQARRFSIAASEFVQVAIYPTPPLSNGVRMWCDPALVLIFSPPGAIDQLLEVLRPAQPMWERLRAHHGRPLRQQPLAQLSDAYPIGSPFEPLAPDAWKELDCAVTFLSNESAIDEIIARSASPQRVVEQTLHARRLIQQHERRLVNVIEHSHGRASDKLDAIQDALAPLGGGSPMAARDLLAPHRHLVTGLEETRQDVERLATLASDTASLVASATVGRLLDRSEANQTATAIVAATLVLISIVTTFTSIASIPAEERHPATLMNLGGWIGAAGIVVTLGIIGLRRTWAARVPPWALTHRRPVRPVITGLALLALAGFAVGASTSTGWMIVVAAITAALIAYLLAVVNDFS